jgi:hypothetical protein
MAHMDKLEAKRPRFRQYLPLICSLKMICEHNHGLLQRTLQKQGKKKMSYLGCTPSSIGGREKRGVGGVKRRE